MFESFNNKIKNFLHGKSTSEIINTNNIRVKYCAYVDAHPKFVYQGWLWANSLIENLNIKPTDIYINHNDDINQDILEKFKGLGVKTCNVGRFGDGTYCNKIAQLRNTELRDSDMVVFMDSDMIVLEDFIKGLPTDKISGKLVDFPNPSIEVLDEIINDSKIKTTFEKLKLELLEEYTYNGNFNGGLYVVPTAFIDDLKTAWEKWALYLLENQILHKHGKGIHVDQVSFCLAVNELNIPLNCLTIGYNLPLHLDLSNINNLEKVFVLHYHWMLNHVGLVYCDNNSSDVINSAVEKANLIPKNNFNNAIFWNYRYATNMELGSGVGSRNEFLKYKQNLVSILVKDRNSVFDIGFGDLELMKIQDIKNYTGIDISDEAIKNAKSLRPEWEFYRADKYIANSTYEYVQCLDVLIHQKTEEDFNKIIKLACDSTENVLLISGYSGNSEAIENNHMLGFYVALDKKLKETEKFESINKVFNINRDVDYYLCMVKHDEQLLKDIQQEYYNVQKNTLIQNYTGNNNDATQEIIEYFYELDNSYKELFNEIVIESRQSFGWYTKHLPRVYEYPWVMAQLKDNCKDKTICDLGAGISAIPLLLSKEGAKVFTIDNNENRIMLNEVFDKNEWGFFDYSQIDPRITSLNVSLEKETFAQGSVDVWYSISVIEHMPAEIRRLILDIINHTLNQTTGEIILTLDIDKDMDALWNYAAGQQVEDKELHGTYMDIINEVEVRGFVLDYKEVIRLNELERVDIVLLKFSRKK